MLTHAEVARYVMYKGVESIVLAITMVVALVILKKVKDTDNKKILFVIALVFVSIFSFVSVLRGIQLITQRNTYKVVEAHVVEKSSHKGSKRQNRVYSLKTDYTTLRVSSTDYNLVSEGDDIWVLVSKNGATLGKIYSKTDYPTVESGLLYEPQ